MNPVPLYHLTNLFAEASENIGFNIFWYVGLVMVTVIIVFQLARKGVTNRVFVGLPAKAVEHMILFIESIAVGVIGGKGRKYVPFLVALWTYIFVSNVFSLIFSFSPTAEWSLNISLAVLTVIWVQWEGIKSNGLIGHVSHFAGPKMVGPMVIISGMLFVIEIISELMKMFSLSIRLYGNIHGGHEAVVNLNQVVKIGQFELPLGGLLVPIKFLTCLLQAYVFVVLTSTYLSLVTHDSHDDHGDDDHSHGTPVTAAA